MDLLDIVGYIAEDNPDAAYRMHDEIEQQAEDLARMPEIGRLGRIRGTREWAIAGTPYILPYRVQEQRILILRVLHGARRWPRHF
jgi:toxin ParE1/3/4